MDNIVHITHGLQKAQIRTKFCLSWLRLFWRKKLAKLMLEEI